MAEPTHRQKEYIRALLERLGAEDDEIDNRLEDIVTMQEASELITDLRADLGE